MKTVNKSGAAIATAAFALAISGATMMTPTAVAAGEGEEAKIHCVGVNTCKGTSDCATATSACAGQNSCKGQGFVALTEAQCDKVGGTVES